jgi:hypothetical protein
MTVPPKAVRNRSAVGMGWWEIRAAIDYGLLPEDARMILIGRMLPLPIRGDRLGFPEWQLRLAPFDELG